MNNGPDFIPIRGKEVDLLMQTPTPGYLYVATDTGKMFMDVIDDISGELIHKAIGGSGAAILYATGSLEELPNGWVRFALTQLEEGSANPNENDLVIHSDGKFLRVVDNTDPDFLTCSVIAVSGTGGGGTGGGGNLSGSAKIEYAEGTSSNMTVLMGAPCWLEYKLIATDSAGDPIINAGEATWAVSNVVKGTEQVYPGDNKFDIGPYLSFGSQTITLKIVINTGGDTPTTVRKSWNIMATELKVSWEYDLRTKNIADQDTTISWMSYGGSLDKTAHIVVDQIHRYSAPIGTVSNYSNEFKIPGTVLGHGAHEIELYLSAMLNGETLTTDVIKHQMLFIDNNNPTPVIVTGNLPGNMQQYDTLIIPYVPYDTGKVGSEVEVIYYENDIEVGARNVSNGTQAEWRYTPTTFGYRKLTIACGTTKKNIDLNVNKIDLGNTAEVLGYAFKLKASDFNDNDSLKKWDSNGVTLSFSDNFDWVNGGLMSEEYDSLGNKRSYINVRAGNTMTINYEPFLNNVTTTRGKCLKVIFKVTQCRDYDAEVIKSCIYDENGDLERGFIIGAQTAVFKSQGSRLNIPYCEDTYIELEIDITSKASSNKGYYITSWIDGIPAGLVTFTPSADNFDYSGKIVIGSADANVQIYAFKMYEKHLTDTEHLSNFIMDAPNATEMMARFIRNDILDARGEIDPKLLAKKNPNCRVHCYEIPRMTTNKDDKIKDCSYIQYHGTDNAVLTATGVTTRVQGTSSAAYGPAAFNLDAKFENGFDYPDGSHTSKWSMDENAIPVNYFTTKVNVASCENANNSLNQEWYNRFQPYISPNRRRPRADGKVARDCMQFYPGVLFILDHNQENSFTGAESVKNNVFQDTPGYIGNPYFKLYAVCNMGNSKKNTEVFHDEENPYECCIEVADNQNDVQRMKACLGLDTYGEENIWVELDQIIDADGNDINVTYDIKDKDGNVLETRTKTAYALWRNTNMSKAGFEFRYPDEFGDNGEDSFEYRFPGQAREALIGWFNFVKWMADSNPAAATNEPLVDAEGNEKTVTYGPYTFTSDSTGKFAETLKGLTVSEFAGTFTTDSEKYRMAKMLSECEQHMVMDSVMFHYLFIERHTMIDNVAKNTFWSSGDAQHWDLTKNYDNDTADGNDNQGKLTLNYGLEPGDTNLNGDSIFNAPGTVWLEFARRLASSVGKTMHQKLENGAAGDPWDHKAYLKAFEDWQSTIPERCWIEAYRRLYTRPYEVYNINTFLGMLEGGKKTHQRRQYETYQNMYISSKYFGNDCETARLTIRPKANSVEGVTIPITVYADCYVNIGIGQGVGKDSINSQTLVRRNEILDFVSPVDGTSNATMYLYPGSFYQEVGDENSTNNLSMYQPELLEFAGAEKMRKLVLGTMAEDGTYIANNVLKGDAINFTGNRLLEELYVVGYEAAETALDLTQCPNLRILDARKSAFTGCVLPNGAPLMNIQLESPSALNAFNLTSVNQFNIADYSRLQTLKLENVDNSPALNSLELLKNRFEASSAAALAYKLIDVQWFENDASNIVNNRIAYLDILLDKNPQDNDGNRIDRQVALTGVLKIAESAYNESNSDLIYNYYCCEKEEKNGELIARYPNLDIIFEGPQAKMPKVTILDQSEKPVWSKRIGINNTGLTEEFFKTGPNGEFTPFESTESVDTVYTFTGKYSFNRGEPVEGTENNYPLYTETIVEDLVIRPVFDDTPREYTITIRNPENLEGEALVSIQAPYGTTLASKIQDFIPPMIDDSDLDTFYTYKFVGYKINANENISSLEDLEKVELRSDTTLTPGYEPVHVYLNPLAENYFTINQNGLISVAQGGVLKGKITVPKEIRGVLVKGLGIGCFQHGEYVGHNTIGITHIFFEPLKVSPNGQALTENTNIVSIGQYAFAGINNLKIIEMPSSINSVSETLWNKGENSGTYVVISKNTTVLPDNMYYNYGGRFINHDDLLEENYSNVINLPKLTSIGVNAFENATRIGGFTFNLPNVLKFKGNIGNNCTALNFGEPGTSIEPNLSWEGDPPVSGTKIWGAQTITLYDPSPTNSAEDVSYQLLSLYFEGTVSHVSQ